MEERIYHSSYSLPKLFEYKNGLVFVLCLSLVIKIILVLFTKVINPDGVLYITAAQQFASGDFAAGLATYPMPAYSLLILLIHFFIRDWIIAALVINVLMSVAILVPLYLLTEDLFDHRAAFWACVAFALSPLPNHWSVEVIRDPSFMFFFAWAAYFGHRAIRTGKSFFFFLAALFGMASAVFRFEGLVFLPCSILFLIGLSVWKAQNRIACIKGIGILIALPLVIVTTLFLLAGSNWASYSRLNEFIQKAQSLLNLGFLDNYKLIHAQLERLGAGSYGYNFTEIARHYIPVIYLIGFVEVFIKVLFPAYLIPLILGLKKSELHSRGYILFLAGCYFLSMYVFHISMNFMKYRFLSVPTFLLYPWIGVGMDRLIVLFKKSSKPLILAAILLLVFVCAPIYRSMGVLWKQDDVVKIAGKWLAQRPEFQGARMIATDIRVPFYAERGSEYIRYGDSRSHHGIEQVALSNNIDVIIIRKSIKRKASIPELDYFRRVKEFVGRKSIVVIYFSRELQKDEFSGGTDG